MSETARRALTRSRYKLAKLLNAEELIAILVAQQHLSKRSAARIQEIKNNFAQNVALLRELSRRPSSAIIAFKEALLATQQNCAVEILTSEKRFELTKTLAETDSASGYDESDGTIRFVEPTEVEFYHRTKKNSYTMTSTPRGYALIVVVGDCVKLQRNEDQNNLKELLCQLGYNCDVIENSTVCDAISAIKNFSANDRHGGVDSCFVSLFCDEQITECDIDKIVNFFNNAECPNLRDKPKLFLIPTPLQSYSKKPREKRSSVNTCDVEEVTASRLPTLSDFVAAFLPLTTGKDGKHANVISL